MLEGVIAWDVIFVVSSVSVDEIVYVPVPLPLHLASFRLGFLGSITLVLLKLVRVDKIPNVVRIDLEREFAVA